MGIHQENKFIAFRNLKLKESDPDFKGEIKLNGKFIPIVIWLKKDRKKEQYLSGAINIPWNKKVIIKDDTS